VADASRGEKLFAERRCDACHSTTQRQVVKAPDREVVLIRDTLRGCLARDDDNRGSGLHFALDDGEASDLAGLFGHERAFPPATHDELLPQMMTALRCGACHNRDHEAAPLRRIIAEESEHGVAPEGIPNLTWAGEKLHSQYVQDLLDGKRHTRARPWLRARMPAYPHYAGKLAAGLAAEHGVATSSGPHRPSKPTAPAPLGDRLTRKDGGLDCRSCHGVGQDEPTGDERTKVAQGINFAHSRERLREEFYLRFVLDPPRHDVTTRMPKLSADGKTTAATAILAGDARKQFEAIWEFIQTARY
jgi:hypothetical protein